jgi:hypothetical protein
MMVMAVHHRSQHSTTDRSHRPDRRDLGCGPYQSTIAIA